MHEAGEKVYEVFAEPGMMRSAFGEALADAGDSHPEIITLTSDVAWPTCVDIFQRRHPDRFFNVGVAEQNMVSIAAGMAAAGLLPFAATLGVFASLRAAEQVRTSCAYAGLNVRIVGSYSGLSAEGNGPTHFAVEDIAVMRAIPHMCVLVPCDCASARAAVFAAIAHEGPLYLRISRSKVDNVYTSLPGIEIGKANVLRQGEDLTIIACGIMVRKALDAAEMLESEGLSARVLDMHTIKPIDREAIVDAAHRTGCLVTAEEHVLNGGLGSAVAEVLSDTVPVPLERVGIDDTFTESGAYEELLEKYGLTAAAIVEAARRAVQRKRELPV